MADGMHLNPNPAAVAPARSGATAKSGRLARTCAEFEALFIQQLFKQMRAAVPRSDLLGGGQAETLYTEMIDGELARSMAAGRGIGLADVLYRQLMDRQKD